MRKVLRGYANTKMAALFLLARFLSIIARINRRRENVKTKDIWSGKAQRSLRRNSLIETVESTLGSSVLNSVLSFLSP